MGTALANTEEPGVWAPGSSVGRFVLLAKLATGGMAEIWLARQTGVAGFERVVVVKRIIDSLSQDEGFVEMFLDEARIAAQLAHPNIVQVFDLGEHAGAYYIAMEYLAGEHLAMVARTAQRAGQPLSLQQSVAIACAALAGLQHAHTRVGVNGKPLEVVHRDVSPQNIIVTWDGQVKLVDFGIAKAANRATQTVGGQLKGKFQYMAPEQAQGTEVDARADVFAIAVLLWELVTGKRLWAMDEQVALVAALINDKPAPLAHEKYPHVPVGLSELIAKGLEKDPARRWQTAEAFRRALELWLSSNGGAPESSELATLMQKLFGARISERAQLIERANRGEMTSGQGELLKPPTNRSMPDGTPFSQGGTKLPYRFAVGIAVAGAALLLLAGGVLASVAMKRAETQTVQPVVQVQDVTPVEKSPSRLTVSTTPPGAQVTLDGRLLGAAPVTAESISVGEHEVSASLEGHAAVTQKLTVHEEGERLSLSLSLPVKPPEVEPKKPRETETAPARGKLTFNTDPWTHVFLNGRKLGETPLINLSLPAGKHVLRCVNEEKNVSTDVEVEVKAGQTTKKVLKL